MGFEEDFGMWEEGPESHSSSFGAVLGGLTMWFDQGFYDYKYKQKVDIGTLVPVSERLIAEGNRALSGLLPRESASRPYDLAQLSLIWPYAIVDYGTKLLILRNVETKLVGSRGVRRYPNDVYSGHGTIPHEGETAEWPLGLAWLSICYSKLAEYGHDFDAGHQPVELSWEQRTAYFDLAVKYFIQLETVMTPEGYVPELYVGKQMGHNTPLAWAQSFHIISGQMLLNLSRKFPGHFRIPASLLRRA